MAMRYRQLGASGLTVSVVGLGCNAFGRSRGPEESRAIVDAALDAGVTLFDTSDVYGDPPGTSERYLGAALGDRRDQVVLATKFGNPAVEHESRASRRYVRRAVEGSLRRLGTDYIDLYQLHAPDRRTPIEETLAALDELVKEGKIRYAGASMFADWEVVEAALVARSRGIGGFVSTQAQYSLVHRNPERELARACVSYGVAILPYYPLASGLLTGKYRRGAAPPAGARITDERPDDLTDERLATVEAIDAFARERGIGVLDVAIGWLANRPGVGSVIAGASRPEQVRANAAASEWQPAAADLAALDAIVPPPLQDLHRQRPPWTR
jgi:aryl-alcohol dehydrogenase-like predicted oxidoreductase